MEKSSQSTSKPNDGAKKRGNPMQDSAMSNEKGLLENTEALEQFREEVRDAAELLEFAVSEGREVANRIIDDIKKAQQYLTESDLPPPEDRATFEKAYRDLAQFMSPITIRTLRDTSDKYGRKLRRLLVLSRTSEARIWSRKLWYLTVVFILFALFGENLQTILLEFYPADEETGGALLKWQILSSILQSVTPFTYGAIGSLAYLLRSCHQFIQKREFDMNRIPEYINRILLGIVSGGSITLFIQEITTDQGAIKISAAALGFLAGYNTDFLFKTIERIAAAILPKVGLETIQRARVTAAKSAEQELITPTSMETLIDLRNKATDDESKKFIEELIAKLVERR